MRGHGSFGEESDTARRFLTKSAPHRGIDLKILRRLALWAITRKLMDPLVLELRERLRLEVEESKRRYIEDPNHETTAKYARSLDDFAQVVMSTMDLPWL
jgi:hypothetical protein